MEKGRLCVDQKRNNLWGIFQEGNRVKKCEEFFKKFEEYSILAFFYEGRKGFTLEELYQSIKERLADESVKAEEDAR